MCLLSKGLLNAPSRKQRQPPFFRIQHSCEYAWLLASVTLQSGHWCRRILTRWLNHWSCCLSLWFKQFEVWKLFNFHQTSAYKLPCDLHSVQGCSFTQIIWNTPHVEGVFCREVTANHSYVYGDFSYGIKRERINVFSGSSSSTIPGESAIRFFIWSKSAFFQQRIFYAAQVY